MNQPAPSPESVVTVLRTHCDELRQAGIRHLSLFGSTARGEADPDSDVDLAVELNPEAHIGLFRLIGLQRRLSEILGKPVDLIPEPVENPHLRQNLERDRRRAF